MNNQVFGVLVFVSRDYKCNLHTKKKDEIL